MCVYLVCVFKEEMSLVNRILISISKKEKKNYIRDENPLGDI